MPLWIPWPPDAEGLTAGRMLLAFDILHHVAREGAQFNQHILPICRGYVHLPQRVPEDGTQILHRDQRIAGARIGRDQDVLNRIDEVLG